MTPDELEERIREAMTSDSAAPGPLVWKRIAERRARGESFRIPPELRAARRRVIPFIVAGVAAVLALVVLPRLRQEGPTRTPIASRPASAPSSDGDNPLLPTALLAQASERPAFHPLDEPIGLRLRAGRWIYSKTRSDRTQPDRDRVAYSMAKTTLDDRLSWLFISEYSNPDSSWRSNDSLWTSRDSLRPFLRISQIAGGRLEQTFREHDVLQGVTTNGFTTWSTKLLSDSIDDNNGAIIRWQEITARVQAANLGPDWKGSIPLSSSGESGTIAPLWLNFEADGEEEIQVPAGTFTCWRIRLVFHGRLIEKYLADNPPPGIYLWVSKDKQWLIRQTYVNRGQPPVSQVLVEGHEETP